jgi:formate hydrogenlyase subunit 6/NADH:ubiquinone oxidoreductase subunit I
MQFKQGTYWSNIASSVRSVIDGLVLTLRHLRKSTKSRKPLPITAANYFHVKEGIATIQYPHQILPVPDNGRYRLHNEIDDCIVCDKCAKICPVNCIYIDPIKSVGEFGKTSDGTPKRIYAAKFDIDMGKCCFCGLCTTVCPTECLTMTKVYDFSVTDITEHNFAFAEMTSAQIEQKKKEMEEYQRSKVAAQGSASDSAAANPPANAAAAKPVFKPKLPPPAS